MAARSTALLALVLLAAVVTTAVADVSDRLEAEALFAHSAEEDLALPGMQGRKLLDGSKKSACFNNKTGRPCRSKSGKGTKATAKGTVAATYTNKKDGNAVAAAFAAGKNAKTVAKAAGKKSAKAVAVSVGKGHASASASARASSG